MERFLDLRAAQVCVCVCECVCACVYVCVCVCACISPVMGAMYAPFTVSRITLMVRGVASGTGQTRRAGRGSDPVACAPALSTVLIFCRGGHALDKRSGPPHRI